MYAAARNSRAHNMAASLISGEVKPKKNLRIFLGTAELVQLVSNAQIQKTFSGTKGYPSQRRA